MGLSREQDRDLIIRSQRGDTCAFNELILAVQPGVRGFLLGLCYGVYGWDAEETAKDLLQETLLRLASSIKTIDDNQGVRSWLRTVARRLFLNMLASHARRSRSNPVSDDVPAEIREPADILDDEFQNPLLKRCISTLSFDHKAVVLLRFYSGPDLTPHKEIADLLGIREDTSRSRLHAAIDKLRECMEKSQ
jgi:RNA polymerase sigma-70 factor (ECF subfamily)